MIVLLCQPAPQSADLETYGHSSAWSGDQSRASNLFNREGTMRELDIPGIFKGEAEDLIKSREDAIRIHGTADIKAAGNEIEIHVREFLERMLPRNLYVTHGHLIDKNGMVSPQLDVVIADKSNVSSLMTTKDGTEYVPIDSVYAVGEIKSTYYKNSKYIETFTDVLSQIKEEMFHEDVPNTAYNGALNDNTLMRDMFLCKGNKTLNKLYSFMLFVNGGDFRFSEIANHFSTSKPKHLPNSCIILDQGVIMCAKVDDKFSQLRYPDENEDENFDWYFSPFEPADVNSGSKEGNHLGFLYYSVLEHIANSYLEPPNLSQYMKKMMVGRKSTLEKASGK